MADPMFVAQRSNNQLSLNFNDVLDVIGQDAPEYAASDMSVYGGVQMGGSAAGSETNFSTITTQSRTDPDRESKRKAYVRIIEQPQPKALRFRYICEGRSAGSIPGINSTAENKTYPAIQVVGYKGPAVVVVSCVTVDPPYRPHPHNLVGKEGCKKGICTMNINNDSMQCVFSNLGIQCVKRRDVEDALKLREEIRVDPFQTGFSHRSQPQSIDLNALRLCFQVFLEGSKEGQFPIPLKPVVSHSIYDKKATSDLIICKLSDCTSSVAGGKEIILLCDKVTKEDIQVRFYEVKDGMIEWESFGDFQASDVHKQVAISFKTPRYKSLEVENPVKVYVQLLRPSDKSISEPRPFQYLPLDSGRPFTSFKRLKNNYGLFQRILGLDSPLSSEGSEDSLRRKTPTPVPRSPDPLEVAIIDDIKPKVVTPAVGKSQHHPMPSVSPPLPSINNNNPGISPPSVPSALTSTSSPPLTPPNQSVDDIRQRLTATLERRKVGGPDPTRAPPPPTTTRPSQFWSDDVSVYSDTDMLDEVLSQGSVNDLLSAVGEGLAVYEDLTAPSEPAASQIADPDAVYGDASYASCYSNLEFVMGQAKAKDSPPSLPPKKNPRTSLHCLDDDDYGEYGTPSGQPIHPNKAALLLERGFRGEAGLSSTNVDNTTAFYNTSERGTGKGCDQLEDLWDDDDDNGGHPQEVTCDQLPITVLDLFV